MRPAIIGATRILQELRQQFDIIDSGSDFSKYRLLILPDEIPCDEEFGEALTRYVADGGALIASYHSGLHPSGDGFTLSALNLNDLGEAPYSPDFIVAKDLGGSRPQAGQVMYDRGRRVAPLDRSLGLADMIQPYFNRTWEHFCSHRHTPSAGAPGNPAIVRNGSAIYFSSPIFTTYQKVAPLWCKRLLCNALDLLLPEPLIRHSGPSTIRATVNAQPAQQRQVVHLLHYIPERRGEFFDVIEDVIPLYDVAVSVRVPGSVTGVAAVPQGEPLPFAMHGNRVEFVVPVIHGHQMIEVSFA
jgi:hypothetical protein